MNIVLFDTLQARESLKPFSYTRALAKLRIGISTIEEKWKRCFQGEYSFITAPYLSTKFPCVDAQENLCIDSTICPSEVLLKAIKQLKSHQKLVKDGALVAMRCDKTVLQDLSSNHLEFPSLSSVVFEGPLTQIRNNWDIFSFNAAALEEDFRWVRREGTTQPIQDRHTVAYNKGSIFIEEGVSIRAAILNAESGPIYIGKNAAVQEGVIIKGPVAIGEEVQISAGARISNATTIGPYARVGGEISNSVILGYSNKAHDGFMGNSVIGEWCNLGAGTNTSNLRNDYEKIKVWDERSGKFNVTKLQFCGLFMGDHSKCAINTMFNAGTIVGISSSLSGISLSDKFIPSFARSLPGARMQTYRLDKALETAGRVTMRRMVKLTKQDKEILTHVFFATSKDRED